MKAVREEVTGSQEIATSFKVRRRAENTQEWKEKPLYGQFVRETEDQSNEETWSWLKQGSLKRETDALITAVQDQAIPTNYIKATIDKSQIDAKSRMYRDKNETVSHIVSSCSKLAQKEYKKRHNNVARAIHWDLSGKCGFDRKRINGTITSVRAYWKMRTTNSFGTSVYEQTITSRLGDQI